VYNPNKEKVEKVGQLLYIRGKNSEQTPQVPCGDMAVVVKLTETASGDTLCDKDNKEQLQGIDFPAPNYTIAITPKSKNDEDKLGDAINKLLEEDPSLKMEKNTVTKQTLLTGIGEAHVNIAINNLKRRYGVDVQLKTPKSRTVKQYGQKLKLRANTKNNPAGAGNMVMFGYDSNLCLREILNLQRKYSAVRYPETTSRRLKRVYRSQWLKAYWPDTPR